MQIVRLHWLSIDSTVICNLTWLFRALPHHCLFPVKVGESTNLCYWRHAMYPLQLWSKNSIVEFYRWLNLSQCLPNTVNIFMYHIDKCQSAIRNFYDVGSQPEMRLSNWQSISYLHIMWHTLDIHAISNLSFMQYTQAFSIFIYNRIHMSIDHCFPWHSSMWFMVVRRGLFI